MHVKTRGEPQIGSDVTRARRAKTSTSDEDLGLALEAARLDIRIQSRQTASIRRNLMCFPSFLLSNLHDRTRRKSGRSSAYAARSLPPWSYCMSRHLTELKCSKRSAAAELNKSIYALHFEARLSRLTPRTCPRLAPRIQSPAGRRVMSSLPCSRRMQPRVPDPNSARQMKNRENHGQ